MAFCKICACGEKVVFEKILDFPDYCPSCSRKLVDFRTYAEDDPDVEKLLHSRSAAEEEQDKVVMPDRAVSCNKRYILKLDNDNVIEIPEEGCIIGRTETGAEELADFPSVSRQHLRITPRRNVGVMVEDLSSYGTLINGQRIEKNTPVRVAGGSRITLCGLEAVLMTVEGDA